MDAWCEHDTLALALRGTDQVLCLVPIWHRQLTNLVSVNGTVTLCAAGELMPHQPVALRAGSTWLAVSGRAQAGTTNNSVPDAVDLPWP